MFHFIFNWKARRYYRHLEDKRRELEAISKETDLSPGLAKAVSDYSQQIKKVQTAIVNMVSNRDRNVDALLQEQFRQANSTLRILRAKTLARIVGSGLAHSLCR